MTQRGDVANRPSERPITGRDGADHLLPAVYERLRSIAHQQLAREGAEPTLQTTGLVHEAYLKLARLDRIRWPSRAYFVAAASQAMRRILVDAAERRGTQKRGDGWRRVPLEEADASADESGARLLALDEALRRLASVDERAARVVEYRFFGGLGIEETAEALEVSAATVKRDWTAARAWLYRELGE
jgi:RNA polymerase sigma-70 factor (ECF subfamily)